MEFKILDDKENKLFARRELRLHAVYDGKTPTRDEIRESVCKKLNLDPETFDIIRVEQRYGVRTSDVLAYSYADKASMAKFARKKGKADKAGAATAAPAK
jgi:ribosomal protein S24E